MINDWKRISRTTHLIVHYLYLSTMFLNGALFAVLPQDQAMNYDQYRLFFLSFLVVALMTFPVCVWIYRRFLSQKNLEVAFKAMGLNGASSAFKTGCILAAIIGDIDRKSTR